jgi:hypothetical protein
MNKPVAVLAAAVALGADINRVIPDTNLEKIKGIMEQESTREAIRQEAQRPLTKTVHFKIFDPDNRTFERLDITAPKGKGLNINGIETAIRTAADHAEEKYGADASLKLVKTGRFSYNIVHSTEQS